MATPRQTRTAPEKAYYGEYSPLAEQFLRRRQNPVYSKGQMVAEIGNDLVRAFIERKEMDDAKEKETAKNKTLADAFSVAQGSPFGLSNEANAKMAFQTVNEQYPELAVENAGKFLDIARQFNPQQEFEEVKVDGGGVMQRNKRTGELKPVIQPDRTPQDLTFEQRKELATLGRPATPQFSQAQIMGPDGKPMLAPFDARTGQIGSPIAQAAPPASQSNPRWKNYYTTMNGNLTQELLDENDPEDRKKIQSGDYTTAAPSDADSAAKSYLDRMISAEDRMQKVQGKGFDPANAEEAAKRKVPLIGNYLVSEDFQVNRQAQEDWVRAKLRKESGATIPDSEMEKEIETYFPQPGDAKETIKAKLASRRDAERQLATQAGILGRQRTKDLEVMKNLEAAPPEALEVLRSDPSMEARKEFDEVFGKGAAELVLKVRK